MHPKLFSIPAFDLAGRTLGPLTLHTYGVLLAIAFLTGLWIASRQAKKAGLDGEKIGDMAVYVLIAGLIGAKLLLVVTEWDHFTSRPAVRKIFSGFRSRWMALCSCAASAPHAIFSAR